jgi:CO/xanthine dehydrogenase Mo-binding subunit
MQNWVCANSQPAAIFDATGVRIRRVPFSPDRVKQALS